MKKEDIKMEATYMHTFTGSVDNGRGWLETLADQEEILKRLADHEEVEEDLPLAEVVQAPSGQWVEA